MKYFLEEAIEQAATSWTVCEPDRKNFAEMLRTGLTAQDARSLALTGSKLEVPVLYFQGEQNEVASATFFHHMVKRTLVEFYAEPSKDFLGSEGTWADDLATHEAWLQLDRVERSLIYHKGWVQSFGDPGLFLVGASGASEDATLALIKFVGLVNETEIQPWAC
ncbi:MAG: hypothetical protein MUC92_12175 [Fimbriimonadaceae bacterium]|jgi:hypothetical protein|nr:hypothetical protein [Fimbriimonadaceae bacterium]